MLAELAKANGVMPGEDVPDDSSPVEISGRWAVIVECDSEEQQLTTLERLVGEGFQCRALIA
jgi:hypothetical protein